MKFKTLYEIGFTDLVSVIPPNAELSAMSKIQADQAGKAPGRQMPQAHGVATAGRTTRRRRMMSNGGTAAMLISA